MSYQELCIEFIFGIIVAICPKFYEILPLLLPVALMSRSQRIFILKFSVKVFIDLCLLSALMDLVDAGRDLC